MLETIADLGSGFCGRSDIGIAFRLHTLFGLGDCP